MGAHSVLPQIFYSSTWNIISADVLNEARIRSFRGVAEDGQVKPCKLEWRFNNRLDNYRPTNPAGPLYGLLQRHMPVGYAADGVSRCVAEATSFSPDQTLGFDQAAGRGLRWVDLIGYGPLNRVSGWQEPVKSPMFRQISRYTSLRAYLPLEDASGAQVPLQAAPGGGPPFGLGVNFAAGSGPSGAGTATAMTATSRLGTPVTSMSSTGGYQIFFTTKLAAIPGSATLQNMFQWTLANGDLVSFGVNNTNYNLRVIKQDGTVLVDSGFLFGAGAEPNKWMQFVFKVTQSGGNVLYTVNWYPQDSVVVYFPTWSYAGSVSRPTNVRVFGNSYIDGALYSHMAVLAGVADNLFTYEFFAAFDGYRSERAADRFTRLAAQYNLPFTLMGTASDTWRMGPQKPDTLINLFKECANTDDALIFDSNSGIGITFRTRQSLTSQTAKMTLIYLGNIGPPLIERIDTADIQNEITVRQRNGGSAFVSLTAGAMSNAAVPAGIGSKKGDRDVNVYLEADLTTLGGWHLSRSTLDGGRYDAVVIDLDANPGLITAANTVECGDRIVITGREPEPIELIVYGISEEVQTHRRTITFSCVPAAPYEIATYSTADTRYDALFSTIGGTAPTTTATAWTVSAATADDVWSTTDTPYDWIVTGERVRVTAMNAATGTGPFLQTCTVTRSVNGVVKAHALGEQVHMAPRTDTLNGVARYTMFSS